MAECSFPECHFDATGGFEHHTYGTAPDVKPKVIDRSVIYWCDSHEEDLQKHVELPGRWLTEEDLDKP